MIKKLNTITSTCFNVYKNNTLKCTNVESTLKLNTKKVVLLHEHTLSDVYTTRLWRYDDALSKTMPAMP